MTIQTSKLKQNGRYQCTDGGSVWPFYIYFNNGECQFSTIFRSAKGEGI